MHNFIVYEKKNIRVGISVYHVYSRYVDLSLSKFEDNIYRWKYFVIRMSHLVYKLANPYCCKSLAIIM